MLDKATWYFSRHWRFLSSISLLIGLVLPWRIYFSDVGPFRVWPGYVESEIRHSILSLSHFENYTYQMLTNRVLDMAFLLGVLSVLLYLLIGIGRIILRATLVSTRWHVILRVTSLVNILMILPFLIGFVFNSSLFIGYYVTAIAIIGSAFLEQYNPTRALT